MRTAPALLAMVAGAAFSGWLVEWLTTTGRLPAATDPYAALAAIAAVAGWLYRDLLTLASLLATAAGPA